MSEWTWFMIKDFNGTEGLSLLQVDVQASVLKTYWIKPDAEPFFVL